MKVVTIKIHEDYAEVLTITAVGRAGSMLNVSTHSIDISKTDTVIIDKDGKATDTKGE
jgi:hypothetical protein